MKVSDLSISELNQRLRRGQFAFSIAPFSLTVQSLIPQVGRNLQLLYGDYTLLSAERATDFQVELTQSTGIRRYLRPQTNFSFDGHLPFKPLPLEQAFALFEWGVNWCVATNAHHYLIIHAAVVARDDQAIILPGDPGAGKSTLCAALVCRGWRLLSDEMTLIDPESLEIIPVPRPVSLKNTSIDLIKQFAPNALFGDVAHDTAKGTVSHMRPPRESVLQATIPARASAVVFPKYQAGAELTYATKEKGQTLMGLAENSFNYHIHGSNGFQALKRLVDATACAELNYSRLDDAITCFDSLLD